MNALFKNLFSTLLGNDFCVTRTLLPLPALLPEAGVLVLDAELPESDRLTPLFFLSLDRSLWDLCTLAFLALSAAALSQALFLCAAFFSKNGKKLTFSKAHSQALTNARDATNIS